MHFHNLKLSFSTAPQGKLEDLVREAFELLLEKKDPQRKTF